MRQKNAILILEAPWELNETDQNTVSVLPFFEGLERLCGNFDLYHSHFYESKSFEMALDNLTKVKYESTYVYIACHGKGKRLHKINLQNALGKINSKAQTHNIVGVVIGACLVGNNTDIFSDNMKGSSITWKFGYKCAVDWLDGTMIDLNVFRRLLEITDEELSDSDEIFQCFRKAISNYASNGSIGSEIRLDEKGRENSTPMVTSKSLSLVIQAKGKGKVPLDYSDLLFDSSDESEES
jgi:hypothetical protein